MSLRDWATAAYGREGVEAACLALQDDHGQSIPFLLWAAWAGEEGRALDAEALAAGQALARRWGDGVVQPLRDARRALKPSWPEIADGEREALRGDVKAAELDSEHLLLEALERLAPASAGAGGLVRDALAAAAAVWAPHAPEQALQTLAAALYPARAFAIYQPAGADRREGPPRMSDETPAANDEATLARLAELRQEHQDLDAAVQALEAMPLPNQLQIARLKKKKLVLRDQIAELEDELTPDIIA